MRVRWLHTASKNLDQAIAFIAKDKPSAAAKVAFKIEALVEMLAEHPQMGREGRIPGTRELIISGLLYVIPYKIKGNEITILRVLHTSRKWPERF